MKSPMFEIVANQKKGNKVGMFSVCSANEFVIESALCFAKNNDMFICIESTANQVNQFGGYTGMKPVDYKNLVYKIADQVKFDKSKIILGGDHLGPLVWCNEDEEIAMAKAETLIAEYILAGFTKIHIDTSMQLKNDTFTSETRDSVIIRRAIRLFKVAQKSQKIMKEKYDYKSPICYVIGSEVPTPGGALDNEEMCITRKQDLIKSIEEYKNAFSKENLQDLWENVFAVVVQPGVEFSNQFIHDYDRNEALDLLSVFNDYENIVFEGHSTDYQTKEHLREMVEDGLAILKVGPWLTFALREVLFLLEICEKELVEEQARSNFSSTLDKVMLNNTDYWGKYYIDDDLPKEYYMKYSYSDRCRYYLNNHDVVKSINILINNLNKRKIPLALLSNYLPNQYIKIRNNKLKNDAKSIILDYIANVFSDYLYATNKIQ